jgi:hypothetical protein
VVESVEVLGETAYGDLPPAARRFSLLDLTLASR